MGGVFVKPSDFSRLWGFTAEEIAFSTVVSMWSRAGWDCSMGVCSTTPVIVESKLFEWVEELRVESALLMDWFRFGELVHDAYL